jgi:bla regulator protein BlaR1
MPRPTAAPVIQDPPAIVTLREERAARWPAWVLAAWAALCFFRLAQIGRSYVYLRGVKRRAIASQEALPPIARPAQLLLSNEIASPMAVGFLHPAVILPESLPGDLAQPEMEHVLLHEVAHIARKDDWTNLLARLLGAALALHPVAWWILRQIEREREIACDDWVVARTGSARPYARSLARMSELRLSKRGAAEGEALASGIFGGGSRLGERIEMLLERGRVFSPRASMSRVAASVVALLGCTIAGALAPRWIAFAQRQEFEAATVKPGDPDIHGTMTSTPPGKLVMKNITLREAVRMAYHLNEPELFGGPKWVDTEHFDIEGKTASPVPRDQIMQMLQSLLADRFKVKVHRETRELPVYALTIAKNGPKLPTAATPDGGISSAPRNVTAKGAMIDTLVRMLGDLLMRPVLNRTGLEGIYNIRLDFAPLEGVGDDTPAPSLFTAIQEQLGLKLEATKGPVEVLVIDSAEKPDAN